MNVIILAGRFGMGHVKAAEAIKEELTEKNSTTNVEIVDFVEYILPIMSKYIYRFFNFTVSRCSGLYNLLNKVFSKTTGVPLKSAIIKKIDDLIADNDVDAFVAVWPICNQYISEYKKVKESNIPLYTCITDITVHEEWIAEKTDKYFVGDISTKNTLISKGVEEEKIVISGIPVRKCFHRQYTHDISCEKKEILIMGGGLGLIPSSENFLKSLNNNNNVHVTLIAGKNKRIYEEARKKYCNIKVLGYTDNVAEYMQKADLLVTKAGGITTFEAIAAKTPLYIIKPFMEQEKGNAEFIEKNNIGRVLWSDRFDETDEIISLINNRGLLNRMKNNMALIESEMKECC